MTQAGSTVFLWGDRYPAPPSTEQPRDGDWWRQYSERLRVSPDALAELSESSRRLVSLLPPANGGGNLPSPVRGVVVGAVQSGKTAHMLAVTARALDVGYKCVVVLAGLKDDLRAQTARRFNVQLLRQRDPLSGGRPGSTMSRAESERRVTALAPPYFLDGHQWNLFHVKMMQALVRGTPVVAVVKKNVAALSTMRERIRQGLARMGDAGFPLLILDDECDEASVEPDEATPTPELISNLWRSPDGGTVGTVAYVGYTATAAANLLQQHDNDLYPSDFVYLLRSPARQQTPLTFREPVPHAWYCGGEVFYERFIRPVDGGSSLLVEPVISDDDLAHDPSANVSLKQAIRNYFVGAGFRRLEHPTHSYTDATKYPPPHTMIVQASTAIGDHDKWARAIRSFLGMTAAWEGVSAAVVSADIEANAGDWADAVDSMEQSRAAINELQPHPWALQQFTWSEIVEAILALLPYVKLRVLNSAPESVDGLDFEPSSGADGNPTIPRDLLSIVVGGGRLSRGLTIDGLSISYFSRQADVPVEDTIQQLSRWYGYRGRHLDYCRVFTTEALAGELTWVHEHDQELRLRLATLIENGTTPRDAGLILSSIPHGLPTAKLGMGKLRNISFSPWCRVVNFVEIGSYEQHNESVAADLVEQIVARGGADVVTGTGVVRGKLSRGWAFEEVIEVLDQMSYTSHNPNEDVATLGTAYKPHDPSRPVRACLPEEIDPYAIAAYLRLWKTAANKAGKQLPTFNVGVAYGSETKDTAPFTIPLGNRQVSATGIVNGGWVGRSDGWPGDQYFDGVAPSLLIDHGAKRAEGAEGLLLLYVVHKDSKGRRDRGVARSYHSPALGISIPTGGPPFRRVVVPAAANAK
jgi:hypothetical protein